MSNFSKSAPANKPIKAKQRIAQPLNAKQRIAQPIIRRARLSDAQGIHEAHMRSIQVLCASDYSEAEIKAWGHRPFQKDQRERAIQKEFVWVIEDQSKIHGYAQLEIYEKNGFTEAYLWGLYLTKEVQGQGLGKQLCALMLDQCRSANVGVLKLEATLTAHQFYIRAGFLDAGLLTTINLGDVALRCIPMIMRFQ
jgi:GNAT superfamily N-acetyltransferase